MDLPDSILMEILSRLPKRDVDKCRVLSKAFAKLTHGSFFKHLHAQRHGQILDGFLLQTSKLISYIPAPDHPSFEFSPSFLPNTRSQIVAVAPNGFLLCEPWPHFPIYCICKPATRQWMFLTIAKNCYQTMGLGMTVLCSNPLHFKIFRSSVDRIRIPAQPLRCELFDSKTWTWKPLEDALLRTSRPDEYWDVGVLASGSVHWKMSDDTIFAFHFDEENWSIIAMPDSTRSNYPSAGCSSIQVAEYEGKLAVMRTVGGDHEANCSMEVWVMEHYRQKTWTKTFVVPLPIPMEGYLRDIPMAFHSSDILVVWYETTLVFYKLEHDSCRRIGTTPTNPRGYRYSLYRFWSDFEPCIFVVPRGRFSPQALSMLTNTDVYSL